MSAFIGTAGWSLPRAEQAHFPGAGSHLERYARQFPVVEINSTFHRSHRAATYARWLAAVPTGFRFSLKVPKEITHTLRLEGAEDRIVAFLEEVSLLGDKIGCLLVQLPPSHVFDAAIARNFFSALHRLAGVPVACEPRHGSWLAPDADALLAEFQVVRVAADPAREPGLSVRGGWRGMSYYRLHGAPKVYYSAYDESFLAGIARALREDLAERRPVWCIFDNTTLGAATGNALTLQQMVGADGNVDPGS